MTDKDKYVCILNISFNYIDEKGFRSKKICSQINFKKILSQKISFQKVDYCANVQINEIKFFVTRGSIVVFCNIKTIM